jgi:hypothetical protein
LCHHHRFFERFLDSSLALDVYVSVIIVSAGRPMVLFIVIADCGQGMIKQVSEMKRFAPKTVKK